VCRFGPARLVLVERFENALFEIHRELVAAFPHVAIEPRVADVCDAARMDHVFETYKPELVFHAAAHKHVPMMEWNPGEAVKNNVGGTRTVADLAHRHGAQRFVLVSTDKAVNPTSVMGATKRVAELYLQVLSTRSSTRFVTVRFGNVLGSAGSVIPIFRQQIAKGGPITVTDPNMQRYFMTIPEASQLVLQAGAMGDGGEIFILDMGEPVRIVDLARDLIILSGLRPGEDIEITFSGVRPGEKLVEELSTASTPIARSIRRSSSATSSRRRTRRSCATWRRSSSKRDYRPLRVGATRNGSAARSPRSSPSTGTRSRRAHPPPTTTSSRTTSSSRRRRTEKPWPASAPADCSLASPR
jgi:FlaA1/EpsC-like NDP-sugar epimerase